MPRSSDSVAALASALAKAQAELVNPEKSLTATIRASRAGDRERTFRYAPLSSGLDIVRKTLGQHEIATMQTTAVDPAAGLINLTTTLAHASGEWIASDWPVCSIADMASPQRMGAALTYARRYALFTLVGIAGEDDLDAPDLNHPEPRPQLDPQSANGSTSAGYPSAVAKKINGTAWSKKKAVASAPLILGSAQSAILRDQLLTEITDLASQDTAAVWAAGAIARKNRLTMDDAKRVEDAFTGKIASFEASEIDTDQLAFSRAAPVSSASENSSSIAAVGHQSSNLAMTGLKGIDKSVLQIPEPRRYRDREHLRFVARQKCLLCGRAPSDPHHLRFAQPRALGRKSSDEFTVPLCRIHHREVHRYGDERAWWKKHHIDPIGVARELWKRTRSPEGGRALEMRT